MSLKNEVKQKMDAAKDHFAAELKNIRTGRANPGMLDSVMVEVYGSPMRLRDVANVTAPEPRQLLISPYDAKNSGAIGKSIDAANLGVRAIVDGNVVRVNLPDMTEEQRKEMVKVVKAECEKAKVSIRNIRREYNDRLKREKDDGDITEDELKRGEKEVQALTDQYCKEADEMAVSKEKEVMAI